MATKKEILNEIRKIANKILAIEAKNNTHRELKEALVDIKIILKECEEEYK